MTRFIYGQQKERTVSADPCIKIKQLQVLNGFCKPSKDICKMMSNYCEPLSNQKNSHYCKINNMSGLNYDCTQQPQQQQQSFENGDIEERPEGVIIGGKSKNRTNRRSKRKHTRKNK